MAQCISILTNRSLFMIENLSVNASLFYFVHISSYEKAKPDHRSEPKWIIIAFFFFTDISRDWCSAKLEENRHVLKQWHNSFIGQKSIETDGWRCSTPHRLVRSKLEDRRGTDVATSDWLQCLQWSVSGLLLSDFISCQLLAWQSFNWISWTYNIVSNWYVCVCLNQELQVDGDLLLNITKDDLINDLGMTSGLTQKRLVYIHIEIWTIAPIIVIYYSDHHFRLTLCFICAIYVTCTEGIWTSIINISQFCFFSEHPRFLRDLCVLKTHANYSMCDPNNLADWLSDIDPRFRQYTYGLVQSGVDRNNILQITEEQLHSDCHVENGIHRAQIISAARRPAKPCLTDLLSPGPDVFISYRRTTGSQLARSELNTVHCWDKMLRSQNCSDYWNTVIVTDVAIIFMLMFYDDGTRCMFIFCFFSVCWRYTYRSEATVFSLMWKSWRLANLKRSWSAVCSELETSFWCYQPILWTNAWVIPTWKIGCIRLDI